MKSRTTNLAKNTYQMSKGGLQAAVRDANNKASSAIQKLGMILKAAKIEKEKANNDSRFTGFTF